MAYWRDVGTMDAYWKANMELCSIKPELNLYDKNWPIWTYQEQLPPAKFVLMMKAGAAKPSIHWSAAAASLPARVSNARSSFMQPVSRPVVWSRKVWCCPGFISEKTAALLTPLSTRELIIPDNTVIGEDHAEDAKRFHISEEGVVLVTPEMMGQNLMFGVIAIY